MCSGVVCHGDDAGRDQDDLAEALLLAGEFDAFHQLVLDDDANDFINYAVDGAKRMDMMINDLLEYSRIGSEEREFNYIMCEKILETVLINLKPLIEDTNAIITHDPLPLIYA